MGDEESRWLHKEVQRLQDYIDDQRRRHSSEIKALREDLYEETKYSEKLRTKLEEEYKRCERLKRQLADKTRLAENLRDDLDDERAYSEKLEHKIDKRAKVIKELEADLLDLEDDYAEARTALKRMDGLRRELEDAKLYRTYSKQRVKQLQDEVYTLRSHSSSSSSSPSQTPSYSTTTLRYAHAPSHSQSHLSAPTQIHVPSTASSPSLSPSYTTTTLRYAHAPSQSHSSTPTQVDVLSTSSRCRAHTPPSQAHTYAGETPALLRRMSSPPSATPELESDYSDEDSVEQNGRLTEDELDEEVAEAEVAAAQYFHDQSDGDEGQDPGDNEAQRDDEDAPGQNLRDLAMREGRLADREYERASEARASGDKEFEKKLRDAGAQHRTNMRNYNRMAAASIFNRHNPTYHSDPRSRTKIDLHHLFVREAEEFVEEHLELCRRAGIERTEIISGRGNHSVGGVAKIRPAVLTLLEKQSDVEVDPHETNPGRIVVRFVQGASSTVQNDEDRDRDMLVRSRMRAGPAHAEGDDVFEEGRTKLRSANRAVKEIEQNLDEIEQGMSTMRVSNKGERRRGLRDTTNNS